MNTSGIFFLFYYMSVCKGEKKNASLGSPGVFTSGCIEKLYKKVWNCVSDICTVSSLSPTETKASKSQMGNGKFRHAPDLLIHLSGTKKKHSEIYGCPTYPH